MQIQSNVQNIAEHCVLRAFLILWWLQSNPYIFLQHTLRLRVRDSMTLANKNMNGQWPKAKSIHSQAAQTTLFHFRTIFHFEPRSWGSNWWEQRKMGCCAPGAVTEPQKLVGCQLSPHSTEITRYVCTFNENCTHCFPFRFACWCFWGPFSSVRLASPCELWTNMAPPLCFHTRQWLAQLAAACHRHSVCRPAVCVLRSPLAQAYAFCARFIRLSPARNSGSKLSLSNFSRAI